MSDVVGHVSAALPEHLRPDWEEPTLRPFWEATADGRFVVQSCDVCGALQWPPRGACGTCRSLATGWREIAGRGRIFSWTRIAHARDPYSLSRIPYVVAIVAHETEPLRFLGALGGFTASDPDIGAQVVLRFIEIDGHNFPVWEAGERP